MKRIKLVNSKKSFIVSDSDYPRVALYDWHLHHEFGKPFTSAYVYTTINKKHIRLSHFILNEILSKQPIDHADRDPLNNDRINLRPCTVAENGRNRSKQCNNSGQFKGISWHTASKLWRAEIQVNKTRFSLGYFKSEIEAAKAYDIAAKQHFGEFAVLNFPGG